jgi:hypothetical protein
MVHASRKKSLDCCNNLKIGTSLQVEAYLNRALPQAIDEGRQMKGILIAVTTVVLGTLAYITLGIALASVS